jgi:hypothetical protein
VPSDNADLISDDADARRGLYSERKILAEYNGIQSISNFQNLLGKVNFAAVKVINCSLAIPQNPVLDLHSLIFAAFERRVFFDEETIRSLGNGELFRMRL